MKNKNQLFFFPLIAMLTTFIIVRYVMRDPSIQVQVFSIVAGISTFVSVYILRNRKQSKYKSILSRGFDTGLFVVLLSHALFGIFLTLALLISEVLHNQTFTYDEGLLSMPLMFSFISIFLSYITIPVGILIGILCEWLNEKRLFN